MSTPIVEPPGAEVTGAAVPVVAALAVAALASAAAPLVAAEPPPVYRVRVLHVRLSPAGLAHLDRLAGSKRLDRTGVTRRMLAYAAARIGTRALEEFHGDDNQSEHLYVRMFELEVRDVDRVRMKYEEDAWGPRVTRSVAVRRMLQFAVDSMPLDYRAPHELSQ